MGCQKLTYYPNFKVLKGGSTKELTTKKSVLNLRTTYIFLLHGMEQDIELSGTGNSYTTEFRQYDPRLGRWKSLDPLMSMFPSMSPYCAFDNNPIYYTDIYGLSSNGPGDPPTKMSGERGFNDKKADKNEMLMLPDNPVEGEVVSFEYTNGDKSTTTSTWTYASNDDGGRWEKGVTRSDGGSWGQGQYVHMNEVNEIKLIAKTDPPAPELNNSGVTPESSETQAGTEAKEVGTTSNDSVKPVKPVLKPKPKKPVPKPLPPLPKPVLPDPKIVRLNFTNVAFDTDEDELDRAGHFDWGSDDITDLLLPAVIILRRYPNAYLTITVGSSLNKGAPHPTYGTVQKLLDARYNEVIRQLKIVYPSVKSSQLKKVTKGNSSISFTGTVSVPQK